LLEPAELYLRVEDLFVELKERDRIDVRPADSLLPSVDVNRRDVEPLKALTRFAEGFISAGASQPRGRIAIVAESPGRRETLSQFFAEHAFHPTLVDDWQRFLESAHPIVLTHGPVAS